MLRTAALKIQIRFYRVDYLSFVWYDFSSWCIPYQEDSMFAVAEFCFYQNSLAPTREDRSTAFILCCKDVTSKTV